MDVPVCQADFADRAELAVHAVKPQMWIAFVVIVEIIQKHVHVAARHLKYALQHPQLLSNRAQLTGSRVEAGSELRVVLERTEGIDGHVAEQVVDSILLFLEA